MFPNPYLILGALLVVIGAFFGGYYKGYSAEHEKLLAFKAQVEAEAEKQKAHNESVVKQQELITEGVKNEYTARISAIHTYYTRRVQQPSAGGGNVSSVSKPSPGTDGSTSDPEFVGRCAETTAQLTALQAWIRKQRGIQ